MTRMFHAECKDCGEEFWYSETVHALEVARGRSAPERCPPCRKANARDINSVGAAFWQAPVETDPRKRCWGKYGLGRLRRNRKPPEEIPCDAIPVDQPPTQFRIIAPVAEALVRNLEDPNGTRVSILVGPTGTGKSTWVPYRMLRSRIGEEGRICVTQPRLVTLRWHRGAPRDSTIPGFIAKHLLRAPGVGAGHEIGFLYRGESTQQDRYTKLLFVTDGVVIRWLTTGEIGQFTVLMIDEAHEQSRNMELIFALLRYQLPRYPRLRVVIASATVDVNKFRTYFGCGNPESVFVAQPDPSYMPTVSAPVDRSPEIDTSGNYPVHNRWPDAPGGYASELSGFATPQSPKDIPRAVALLVQAIRTRPEFTRLRKPFGDILVFVPTLAIVDETVRAIRAIKHECFKVNSPSPIATTPRLQVLPCHAQMSEEELATFKKSEAIAAAAFKQGTAPPEQRVIVATNYAETSVTLSNLSYVIDSGYIMEPAWDSETCSVHYPTVRHTQAGCRQRKGRVGRVQPGECFHLYTREEFARFREQPGPAIAREPLDTFLLTAKAAGIDELESFEWLGRAETCAAEISRSISALARRGALDGDGDITNRGVELDTIEADTVDLLLCMSESDAFGCALEVATFLAFIGLPNNLFRRGTEGLVGYDAWRQGCYDDLEFYLRLFHHWSLADHRGEDQRRKWCRSSGVDDRTMRQVSEARERNLRQFSWKTHTAMSQRALDLDRLHRVRLILARCIPEWTYVRNSNAASPGLFVPYKTEAAICTRLIEIDEESACHAVENIEAFVCVQRTRIGDRLVGRHIVRIEQAWLEHLEAGAVARAYLLRRALEKDLAFARTTRDRVLPKPRLDFAAFQSGHPPGSIVQARVIRYQRDAVGDTTGWLLARELSSGIPVLMERVNFLAEGAVFRAHVIEVDAQRKQVVVSQEQLFREYAEGRRATGTAQRTLASEQTGEPYKLLMDLEPGICGSLHRTELPYASRDLLKKIQPGETLDVVVLRTPQSNSDLHLTLPEVYEAKKLTWRVGQVVNGIVQGFDRKDDGRVAAFVEVAPGVDGYLPRRNIGLQEVLNLSQWKVGRKLDVVISEVHADARMTLRSAAVENARGIHFSIGQRIQGLVAGFDYGNPPGETPVTIFVEVAPGRQGYVPRREFGRWADARLRQLFIGSAVNVLVSRAKEDGNPDLKLWFPPPKIGDTYRGLVDGFLPGQFGHARAAAFVEIVPGVKGFLHYSRISEARLLALREGDQLDVTIIAIEDSGRRISLRTS